MADIRVGISGWSYPRWRGDFYPRGLRQRDELAYAAERMTSIEVNASFYSLQRPSSYAAWRAATPAGFELAVKGGRFITHVKRLREVEAPLANFFASGVLALGDKLGPVLWQLPETFAYDPDLMERFYRLLPRTTAAAADLGSRHDERLSGARVDLAVAADRPVRHVLEFRNPGFCAPAAIDQMRTHGIGCVVADSAGRWPQATAVTSEVVYVRLHGHTELYASGYSAEHLDRWADRCRAWAATDGVRSVRVYFDNDARGRAPYDAMALLDRVGRVGLEPTTQGL